MQSLAQWGKMSKIQELGILCWTTPTPPRLCDFGYELTRNTPTLPRTGTSHGRLRDFGYELIKNTWPHPELELLMDEFGYELIKNTPPTQNWNFSCRTYGLIKKNTLHPEQCMDCCMETNRCIPSGYRVLCLFCQASATSLWHCRSWRLVCQGSEVDTLDSGISAPSWFAEWKFVLSNRQGRLH